jgi:hypothetical protein
VLHCRSFPARVRARSQLEKACHRPSRTVSILLGMCYPTRLFPRHADIRPSSQPHGGIKYGGASPVDPTKPSVAGTTPESRKGYSADHNVKTRSDPNVHDGTSGGGVGVAEMRERKMDGRGLPSPQVSLAHPQHLVGSRLISCRAETPSLDQSLRPKTKERAEVSRTRRVDGG